MVSTLPRPVQDMPEGERLAQPYGEGFAALYAGDRYALFSRRLATLALQLLARHGAPGHTLLDLACGAGAGTAVLAAAGYRVTGVDRSPAILVHARARLEKLGLSVRLEQQEMQTLSLPAQVDAVTCLFDALNYLLSTEELQAVFSRVAGVLRPNGLFVFDMNTIHGLAIRWGSKACVTTVRQHTVEVNSYQFEAERCLHTVRTKTFVRRGDTEAFERFDEVHQERGYPVETVTELLDGAGFAVVSTHGLHDQFQGPAGLQPLTDGIGRMVVVARRR
jgi:SAM-dependent methyltransferase